VTDAGDFDGVCDIINKGRKTPAIGDANGYDDRASAWSRAQKVLR
jgi:putative chitinase